MSIDAYVAALPPDHRELALLLRAEFDKALPKASSKVWHGHPVWFDGENPVVGFDDRRLGVNVLFWNGQALGEPALLPIGKFRAAGLAFASAAEVDVVALRRWLRKAKLDVFDGVTHFRQLREAAKAKKATEPAQPSKPAKASKPTKPAKASKPTEPAKATKASKPTKPAKAGRAGR